MNVGHCHPDVVSAIKDQAEKYIHTCFHIVMYEPYMQLAEEQNRLRKCLHLLPLQYLNLNL